MYLDYVKLALGNLKHRGLRSALTMLGIFIGIAAVVSLISLGQGLQEAITSQFNTLSADRLVVQNAGNGFGPPGSTVAKKLTQHDVDLIKDISGVKYSIPRLIRIVKLEYNEVVSFNYVGSMPDNQEQIDYFYTTFRMETESGKLIKLDDSKKVVLGHDFTKSQDEYGKEIRVGSNILIQGNSFEVVGILKEMSSFQFNSVILMNEKDLKEVLSIEDEVDLIVVQVKDIDLIDQVSSDITRKLRKDRGLKEGDEDFTVQTPVQVLGTINTILTIINVIIAGIAAISLLVGGIGIANTMFTSVLQRRKEIGTMKAVGAKNSDVWRIFVIESGLLGFFGGVIGAAMGLGIAFGISALANAGLETTLLKVSISWPLLIASVLFSLIIGLISGLIPAYQASRQRPTEALRG